MAMPDSRAGTDGDVGRLDDTADDLSSVFADEPPATPPVRLAARPVRVPAEAAPASADAAEPVEDLLDVLDEPLIDPMVEVADDSTGEYEVVDAPRQGKLPRGRVKARKVHRVIRYVSPWSVFKVSLLFSLCLWMIVSIAGVLLWQVALASGTVTQFEEFLAKLFAEESFMLDGRQMFRATAISGVIIVFAGTAFAVLMALLFNVISDITGGIRLTMLELESAKREVRRSSLERMDARQARRRSGRR